MIAALLQLKTENAHFVGTLINIRVKPINDGGMGSLLLVPEGLIASQRSFDRQILLAEAVDSDGIPVSIALNVDQEGHLFELDVWKVDFTPLWTWPDPIDIKLVE